MRIQLWDPLVSLVTEGFLDHQGKATLNQLVEHLTWQVEQLSELSSDELRSRIEDVLVLYGGSRFERVRKTPPTWKLLPVASSSHPRR